MELGKPKHSCKHCGKNFSSLSNKNKHEKLVHESGPKKYIHHIKKDKLFLCSVCGKEYKQSFNLKIHYARDHSKQELESKKIPVAPVTHYSRRITDKVMEKETAMQQLQKEKRDAFVLLD